MNITYFLGAGASANCLPIINNFNDRLIAFRNHLIAIRYFDELTGIKLILENLITDVEWLIKEAKPHQTIDTLAKKYFHQSGNYENLLRMKTVMVIFFTYEQSYPQVFFDLTEEINNDEDDKQRKQKEAIDRRYDSFIASILRNKIGEIELSGNVKVITWNYDLQFELAFQNYVDDAVFDIQRRIQSLPNRSSFDLKKFEFDHTKFGLIRLNGIALADYVEQEDNYRTFFDLQKDITNDSDYFAKLIELYNHISNNKQATNILRLFNYSWEALPEFKGKYQTYERNLEIAKEIARKTDVLIVIGYSFPFFNREIDREIIGSLTNVERIYIQDIYASSRIDHFKNSFKNFIEIEDFIPIEITSSFYLPPEL